MPKVAQQKEHGGNKHDKANLARRIAEQMNIHIKDADTFLTTFTDIVGDSIVNGEPVRLAGFGTFDIRHVAAHGARNQIPANLPKSLPHTTHIQGRQDTESQGS